MIADRVVEAAPELVDRPLELRVLERGHPAAAVADQVVMVMLAAGQRRLVAGGAVADVEALDEAHRFEQLERPVDGRDADRVAAVAELVGDLAGAEDAVLLTDQGQHGSPRGARAVAGGTQRRARRCRSSPRPAAWRSLLSGPSR